MWGTSGLRLKQKGSQSMLGSHSCKWRNPLLLLWDVDSPGTLLRPSQKEQVTHTDEMFDQEIACTRKSIKQLQVVTVS